MSAFVVLVRMRMLDVVRSRSTFVLFMTLPLVLLVVVALVFANGHPFERKEVLLVGGGGVGASATEGVLHAQPEVRLVRVDDEETARIRVRARMASAYVASDGVGGSRVVAGPREGLFARGLGELLRESESAPRPVRIETIEVPRWGYVHYLFPGLLTFSVLLAGLFGMGYAMVRYRATSFLKKLATTPLRRSTFVAAQVVARTALVLVQLVAMVAVGRFGFGLPIGIASASWLALVTVLGLVTFMGAGFALACAIKSEALVVDVINALGVPLVFFSEIFFPLSELPGWLGSACAVLPSTAMVRLTREIVLFGASDVSRLAPGLAQLGAWGLATYGVSIVLFRWHR